VGEAHECILLCGRMIGQRITVPLDATPGLQVLQEGEQVVGWR